MGGYCKKKKKRSSLVTIQFTFDGDGVGEFNGGKRGEGTVDG